MVGKTAIQINIIIIKLSYWIWSHCIFNDTDHFIFKIIGTDQDGIFFTPQPLFSHFLVNSNMLNMCNAGNSFFFNPVIKYFTPAPPISFAHKGYKHDLLLHFFLASVHIILWTCKFQLQ